MQVILNIGLNTNTGNRIGSGWVVNAARLAWFKVTNVKVHQSDSEPTAVLTIEDDAPGLDNRIYTLSRTLGQDCIAVWYPEEAYGDLLGPKAAAWGQFNPEFFILPDGARLGNSAAKAA